MKKLKIRPSIVILLIVCIIFNNFLLLFNYIMALILHELAHLFVANRRGYKLKLFVVDMFGCSVELEENIDDKDSFAINIAGPLMNIFLCIICMALYWLIPSSYEYLNLFCMSNLVLAGFNLLPLYPLDGGKIICSLIKSERARKIVNIILKCILTGIFLALFIVSTFSVTNWFYLVMVIFFLTPSAKRPASFSLFKSTRERRFAKVELIKVSVDDNLYSLLKHIKKSRYTIFYCNMLKPAYVDEDMLITLATKYPLASSLKDIKFL